MINEANFSHYSSKFNSAISSKQNWTQRKNWGIGNARNSPKKTADANDLKRKLVHLIIPEVMTKTYLGSGENNI